MGRALNLEGGGGGERRLCRLRVVTVDRHIIVK